MRIATFKGGVHPYDGKELSASRPTETMRAGKELVLPLAQHIGAPARPVASVGDRVLMGQTVGEPEGEISAAVHSPVSGTVTAVEPRECIGGEKLCVVIENDGKYEKAPLYGVRRDVDSLDAADIISIIRASGIVGMGGAGFPTHVKLSPKWPEKIDYILINGAECEPYLTCDYRVMLERADELIGGIRVLQRLFPNAQAVIGIEDNKGDLIELLNRKLVSEHGISVRVLKTKYPQGGERMLIKAVTGRELEASRLPSDIGCVVQNSSTVTAIYESVALGIPLISRVVTITGDAVKSPRNLLVPIGMSHRQAVDAAGGFSVEPALCVSGGPMMGVAMDPLDAPITKTSCSVLAFLKEPRRQPGNACIRCGRCHGVCPERLMPSLLYSAAGDEDGGRFEKLGGLECMSCGACSFVCPAKLPLSRTISGERAAVLREKRKKAGA